MPVSESQGQGAPDQAWLAAALRGEPVSLHGLDESGIARLVQAAIEHGVSALLHHVLFGSDSWESYPENFREALAQPARQLMAVEMVRGQDLGQLLDQLDEAGIPCLLIKGGGLAFTHYPRSYLRERCDTDILFADQAAFDRAWALFESLGYQRRNTLSGEFVGYQHCCWRPLASGIHQVLDCHIKINDYLFYANAFSFEELLEQSVPVPALAASARTLGPLHALMMACIHRAATIPLGNADRLIWFYDMHLLAKPFDTDDWAELLQLAQARSVCGTIRHSLEAAMEFFPVAVPANVMDQLGAAAEKEPFQPGEEMKRWQYYRHAFRLAPGIGGKLRLIREHFLPSPAYMMEKYETRSRISLPFLYLHRVFAGLKRYF